MGTSRNNTTHTVSLPTKFPSQNLVTIATANIRQHWANISSKNLSSIVIYICDYGEPVNSGAYWMSCGI